MTTNQEIASLAEFMDWVQQSALHVENEQSQEKQISFYRGHADENYQLMPSVYRVDNQGRSYRAVEYELYQDMLHRNPTAFVKDQTIFERLVRMQHHGLPTRLLDITQSPLVALYFACEKFPDKEDGQVIFFCKTQLEISYPSAIPQAALVGLDTPFNSSCLLGIIRTLRFYLTNINEHDVIYDDNGLNDTYHKFLSDCIEIITTATQCSDLLEINEILKKLEQEISGFTTKWSDDLTKKAQELQNIAQKQIAINAKVKVLTFESEFRDFAKSIITDCCKRINIQYDSDWLGYFEQFSPQFTYFHFVYPPLNNERIRRQQGAFLIFPPVQSSNHSTINHFCKAVVTIKAEAKESLLKELANLGVTRSYLFPELEEQAKDILLRYPPTAEINP